MKDGSEREVGVTRGYTTAYYIQACTTKRNDGLLIVIETVLGG